MKPSWSAIGMLAALALCPAQAFAQATGPERLVSVTGEGTVDARPDIATIAVGVVSQAPKARDALGANTADMGRVLDQLKAGGIAPRDLQTSGFSVEPVYSQPPANYDNTRPFEPRIIGYRVSNNLTVRVRDLAKTGDVLDQVIALGANSVSGPVFDLAERQPKEDEARRAAIADALRKGELYATAAGVKLGPIARIEESGGSFPQPMEMMAAKRESFADAAVPVEAGELTFRRQVSVSWRIGD